MSTPVSSNNLCTRHDLKAFLARYIDEANDCPLFEIVDALQEVVGGLQVAVKTK